MKILMKICPAIAALIMMIGLGSCQPDWEPAGYPAGGIDPYLTGTWILVQYNSEPIMTQDANWFYFNGRSGGYYYYYNDWGRPATEPIAYETQYYPGDNRNYLYIDYAGGGSMEGTYWFTHQGNTLWIQWTDNRGYVQTYVYDRVRNAPW